MKTVVLDPHGRRNCEGITRRDVLKVGALSFFGLTLPQFFALRSAAAAESGARADAVILLWLAGGPSHLDTFDPKPSAPSEIRGEFGAIGTNVPGIQISEHLPNTAKVMDKIALVRSLSSNIAAHEQASQYLLTGYKPMTTLEYPSYGSDVAKEPAAVREMYGISTYGQGCLLARRLVEAGARFVTVSKGGWDTHANNFKLLGGRLLPELDKAYAALLTDLSQRGMLDKTLVLLMGEFGRTPKVNPRGGRDHWSRCRFVAFAGGGMKGGQVIGRSDEQGAMPVERPVSVEDVATTIYTALGIETNKQYITPTGRPIPLPSGSRPIRWAQV